MLRTLALVSFLALAACGGKSQPAAPADPGPAGGGRMAAPGTVVGDPAIYQLVLDSTIALPIGDQALCGGEEATLGAQAKAWAAAMGGSISASCEGNHCTVFFNSTIDPSCDTDPEQDGCDGSNYSIEFDRGADGGIVAESLQCMAAG